jgi:NAD(P) transhydrogenase
MVGGVCVQTGTIPSKTMREAVLHLTGLRQRELYGESYRVKQDITVEDLAARTEQVVAREVDVIRNQLTRNHVELLQGTARFVDPNMLAIGQPGEADRKVTADTIVIATGSEPARPDAVEFDDRIIIDSDGVLGLDHIPTSMVVVGAGVIGVEYASMFAGLGTKVTLVDQRPRMLEFLDMEIVEALQYHLRDFAVTFRFGEKVAAVEHYDAGTVTLLDSGKRIPADTVLYSAGRYGATGDLDLPNAGLEADDRGRIPVDATFKTDIDHIYAVGDVIGFPALAATAMEQGRLAANHALGEAVHDTDPLLPVGIYSIPEISYVGQTEEELTEAAIPYEVGRGRYRELARGQIIGDSHGVLKLLVSATDRSILGVHVFGSQATELVHIGQAVMVSGGTVDSLVDVVFNYPTLAEAYKVAALDAANKLRALDRLTR